MFPIFLFQHSEKNPEFPHQQDEKRLCLNGQALKRIKDIKISKIPDKAKASDIIAQKLENAEWFAVISIKIQGWIETQVSKFYTMLEVQFINESSLILIN